MGCWARLVHPGAGWILSSASTELPNAACAPTDTYYAVLWYNFDNVYLLILGVSSGHLFTIVVSRLRLYAAHPAAATFTQSDRIHILCVPPPLPCIRGAPPLTQVGPSTALLGTRTTTTMTRYRRTPNAATPNAATYE